MEVSENDWKLFRARLPVWQERYAKKLCKENSDILNGDRKALDKFSALEKRIREDKGKCGICAEIRRSLFYQNLFMLLEEGAISLGDLDDFSEDVREISKRFAASNTME